ncbi:MAG TPA: ABC transporter ATP-binding protein [Acholeplasmataceae bacterium]|nr:ABC transporter ATP-binding protein [Acholeplasmataceae bacterium]
MILIEARKLTKEYVVGNFKNQVIKGIDLEVKEKEFISIVGPSGSGKTTLLYLLSGLEKYTTGEILLFNKEINLYNDKEMSLLRQKNIGFVFQFFNLIPNLNVFENVEISAVIAGIKDKSRIEEVLKMVGMEDSVHLYPNQISGGMQQRVAIARALVNNPDIIFADEPIGNLDYNNGIAIMEIFKKLNTEYNKTIILVTHNEDMKKYGTRYLRLIDGKITEDEKVIR